MDIFILTRKPKRMQFLAVYGNHSYDPRIWEAGTEEP
jgi:hypothetical protein